MFRITWYVVYYVNVSLSGLMTSGEEQRTVLAHLGRRLIGELIVYEGIRRPSVVRRPSVRLSTFSNDISSEAEKSIPFMFHI